MPTLKLSLLGPPQIELDGAPVHVSRHKAVALLAYLAVTGQWHRCDALATLLWPEHDQSRARAGLRRALSALREALGDRWGMASVSYHLGDLLCVTGAPLEAEPLVREGLAAQQALDDHRGMAGSLRVSSVIALGTGRPEESVRLARESVALFQQMDDRAHAAEALLNLGRHLGFLGRLDEAHSRLEESITIYRDLGFGGSWRSLSLSFLARIDMLLGRYEQASSLAREALLLAQEGGYVVGIAYALWVLGRLAIAAGEYAEVQRILELNSSVSDEASLNLVLWFPGVLLGYAARGMSYPGRARQPLCEALRLYSRNGELGLLLLLLPAVALLLADRGEVERAVELYALVSRYPYVANAQWFEDAAGKHIAAAAVTLPPDVVVAAQERGRARDLMATAKELLAELEADLDKEDRLVGTEPSA